MKFVSRVEWGARKANNQTSLPSPDGVAFHWEGPRMGPFAHDKCAGKIRGIQAFHMDTRGWADIAYSALVCPHGYVYEGRGIYRTAANGTNSSNSNFGAVCYLGGDGDGFSDAGKIGMMDARAWLQSRGFGSMIRLHRNFLSTACPGNVISAWVEAGCKIPGPTPAPAPKPAPTPEPTPVVPPHKEIDMLIVLAGDGVTQYICDGSNRRHINGATSRVYRAAGVPMIDAEAPAYDRDVMLAGLVEVENTPA